ncbi:hypothetical protein KC315_g325 [Hortaea werneckii]|nr:hypothetical protein KC315_g325 [Hortaea werneckii]KAI7360679.1 hypothetical protein KC354_g8664 [Hortaea werneckii]
MAPKRGTRSAPRTRGPSARSRGAIASPAGPTGSSTRNVGIRKPAPPTKKRPVQRRIAKALQTTPTDAVDVVTQAEGAESQPAPNEPDAKVQRVIRDYMCSSWSLDFVYNLPITDEQGEWGTKCLDNTSKDTDIIALNLIDHFMQPENEIPELRYGILPAASFALACDLTKVDKDFEMIAEAVQVRVAMFLELGVELPPEALGLTGADVRKGCAVMLERRKELYPLVGGYAHELAHLARSVLGLEEVDEEFRYLLKKGGEARGEEGGNTDDNLDVSVDQLELTVEDEAAAVEDLMEAGMKNAEEEELIDFDVFDESEVDGV